MIFQIAVIYVYSKDYNVYFLVSVVNYSSPCIASRRAYISPELLSFFILFLAVPLDTNYLKICWTNLHQLFRIDTYMAGHDQSDLLFAIAQGTFLW